MLVYIGRRLVGMVPILLVVAVVIFMFLHLIPGDPARLIAGTEASLQDVENVRQSLGLDLPIWKQFWLFFSRAIQGDFGMSYRTHQPVFAMISERFWPTLELAFWSMIWAIVAGLALGVVAATRRGKWADNLAMFGSVTGISMPSFWLGLLLIELFAVQLGWLPSGGSGGFKYVILPAITLGSGVAAVIARFTRNSLLETLREDYVRTARAKGARERVVVWSHALRNALIPVVTMTGLQFGFLLGGSVVVEAVFTWPGMGRLLIDAVNFRDYPVIQAEMLLFALEFMVINMVVDVLYAVLNPQIRLDR
ncbi:nickel ABC transporter permease [Tumebacillus permanentifrigoris]|uniref:Glutathione transport system permease protein GsiC n=1 Tax=Tumebacillus permanentifrigoris TaxID=378543 RepID=A0A316DFN8_9BACL|nr:nickel ABC transporter permease [Tumebacillus permanentifrigoris]PWK16418.1 glutathione transport system permease protein [Tumebacillus permanentifrigoris]